MTLLICLCVGMAAECQMERSQIRNKEIALTVLRSRFVKQQLIHVQFRELLCILSL